jgi:hypothetical protein
MALPKINHPLFDLVIPSSKRKIKVRPMLVREEKLLLIAKSSEDAKDVLSAVKQVVNNCIMNEDIDVDKLAIFDIEYIFVKIRAFSISNISKVSYKDNEDGEIYDFDVDLDNVEVIFPENIQKNIRVTDNIAIVMKYAEASLYDDAEFSNSDPSTFYDEMVIRCIDSIYEGDTKFDPNSVSKDELKEYLASFDINVYDNMRKFVASSPTLNYEINYKNSKGSDRKIVMSSLNDFFTLR